MFTGARAQRSVGGGGDSPDSLYVGPQIRGRRVAAGQESQGAGVCGGGHQSDGGGAARHRGGDQR